MCRLVRLEPLDPLDLRVRRPPDLDEEDCDLDEEDCDLDEDLDRVRLCGSSEGDLVGGDINKDGERRLCDSSEGVLERERDRVCDSSEGDLVRERLICSSSEGLLDCERLCGSSERGLVGGDINGNRLLS